MIDADRHDRAARDPRARAGGIERHVEELSTRLAARGHEVTVFCRPGYSAPAGAREYRGVHLSRPANGWPVRGGEAFVHSGLGAWATHGSPRFDVAHFHAVGPGHMFTLTRALSQ